MNDNKQATSAATELLPTIDRKRMLFFAHMHLWRKYRKSPLWALVGDICGCGSTYATVICWECGWDPHQEVTSKIQNLEIKI